ncbi:MAG TPA: hypothetical protein VLI05_03875 [Candidatus Saccharimonadia bacterium]|nr:hypothetical protein [Candidatus Saccharimonadia bacterium]
MSTQSAPKPSYWRPATAMAAVAFIVAMASLATPDRSTAATALLCWGGFGLVVASVVLIGRTQTAWATLWAAIAVYALAASSLDNRLLLMFVVSAIAALAPAAYRRARQLDLL